MKNIIKYILATVVLSVSLNSCRDSYLDTIKPVAAGADAAAPQIEIVSPSGNVLIPFIQTTTDFKLQYNVTDDVELSNVEIYLDGTKLSSNDKFLDYRIFKDTYTYKNLGLGDHTFRVDAKDLSGKTSTKSFKFNIDNKYTALYGEKVYMPFFAGGVYTDLLSGNNPTIVGSPSTVSGGYDGAAYKGATDSYIKLPLAGLYSSNGISFTFWYKVNTSPDRSGIITINDDADNSNDNRTGGLRLFREGSTSSQTIKLNVGLGAGGESWNDGGNIAANGNWVHIGVTVSPTESKIYFNGVLQRTATYTTPFSFSSSTDVVIGSGAPSFTYWGHNADLSLIDDLRIYNKALTEAEVKATVK